MKKLISLLLFITLISVVVEQGEARAEVISSVEFQKEMQREEMLLRFLRPGKI